MCFHKEMEKDELKSSSRPFECIIDLGGETLRLSANFSTRVGGRGREGGGINFNPDDANPRLQCFIIARGDERGCLWLETAEAISVLQAARNASLKTNYGIPRRLFVPFSKAKNKTLTPPPLPDDNNEWKYLI